MRAWPAGDPRIDRVRQVARALARSAGAIDLRLARVCCFIQQQDLRPLGYSSFTAFIREEICWDPSWQRRLARLLRSDLHLVKAAVVEGVVPLTRALDAPGRIHPDEQRAWIEAVLAGAGDDADPPADLGTPDRLTGKDAATVRRARRRTRLLLGRRVPDRVADQQMLAWHAQRALPADLLDQARAAPPPPDLSPASWPDPLPDQVDDPTTLLLGPWTDPATLHEALDRATVLMAARDKRRVALARLLVDIHDRWMYLGWGFDRFDDWVRNDLDMSVRHAWRLRAEGRAMAGLPTLARAVDQGLPTQRARALASLSHTADELRRWLAIVDQLPTIELQRTVARRGRGSTRRRDEARRRDGARLRRYEALRDDAPDLVRRAIARRQDRLADAPLTETRGHSAGLAGWTADARPLGPPPVEGQPLAGIRIALHDPDPAPDHRPHPLVVAEGVLEAARWLLDTLQLPRERGTGRIRPASDYTCANPECRTRSLRVQVHHVQPRALGGTDEDANLRCLCPSCHLRLVHGGFMAIEVVDGADVFLYPGRAVVVR
ncbi:MAG: HNH endonuclease [Deltaproteobacteria bacterium]|nr:MAG: HNH endonuclease [Deltaproteobacteria bacterium]